MQKLDFFKTIHQSALVPNWCHLPMKVRPTQRWKMRSCSCFSSHSSSLGCVKIQHVTPVGVYAFFITVFKVLKIYFKTAPI